MNFFFNFNFSTNYSLQNRGFQIPSFGTTYTTTKYNPAFTTPTYSTGAKSSSLLDMMTLIASLKDKFSPQKQETYGYTEAKSEPVVLKDAPLSLDEDFTVMQNYGIVCPKATKESTPEITEAKHYANYGIVLCSDKEEKPVYSKPQETKFRSDDTRMYANYGIILCSSQEQKDTFTKTELRSDGLRACANYGIVCPGDI